MTLIMTNEEIIKYEQELTELSKSLNKLRLVEDSGKKYPDLKSLYQRVQALAANVGTPLSNANIMNITINVTLAYAASLESVIGELINNIHNTLQTKMMLNACISSEKSCNLANWSCFFAAFAAIVACISVILTMCLN